MYFAYKEKWKNVNGLEGVTMHGGWTEITVLWRNALGFVWDIPEFEHKVDTQNHQLGGYILRIVFFKLWNDDDKKCQKSKLNSCLETGWEHKN